MKKLQEMYAFYQPDMDSFEGSSNEVDSLSQVLKQIMGTNTDESLSLQLDRLVKLSVPTVLNSILSRAKTQQVKELQEFEKQVNSLFDKYQLASNSKHQVIWLVGHLSTLLDLISLLDSTLELEFDERLIPIVDKYKHAASILSILYDRPLLTHGELAQALNLSKSTLSNALSRMKDCRLVFADKHGREKYYTLSTSGKKVHNHLKLLGTGITPDRLTVYIERIFEILCQVFQRETSSKEAMDRFSQIVRQCTTNSPNLKQKMRKTIEAMESIQNDKVTELEALNAKLVSAYKENADLARELDLERKNTPSSFVFLTLYNNPMEKGSNMSEDDSYRIFDVHKQLQIDEPRLRRTVPVVNARSIKQKKREPFFSHTHSAYALH